MVKTVGSEKDERLKQVSLIMLSFKKAGVRGDCGSAYYYPVFCPDS